MQSPSGSHFPIHPKDLVTQKQIAFGLLTSVEWAPKTEWDTQHNAAQKGAGPNGNAPAWRPAMASGSPKIEKLSLMKTAQTLSGGQSLLSEDANFVLITIQTGLSVGFYLAEQYLKAVGSTELRKLAGAGQLTQDQKDELQAKGITASAVAVFSAAAYINWKLSGYKEDKVSMINMEFHGIPEVDLQTIPGALKCFTFYLAAYLDPERTGLVKSDLAMVRMGIRFSEAMMNEIKLRLPSLKYVDAFTNVSYQLAETDFTVEGFEVKKHTAGVSVEFNRVGFGDIVGNQAAKHAARRLASRLACYDLKQQRNPFLDLGGFPMVQMGYGKPGTGKTMQISATATLLHDLCEKIEIPFLFWPLPDNVVSTFQGGSAERMLDWMKRLQDPDKVIFAPIDDGENNLEERTRNGVSAGVREVIGVFLRYTEGAYALIRGNTVIIIFTNLPEQIDKAVLSRIQDRFPINGATTVHDFGDQDHLWWRKLQKVDPKFVNMTDIPGYNYLDDQKEVKNLLVREGELGEPNDERIRVIYRKMRERYDLNSHGFFATLFTEIHQLYPFFTSRDVRNIQQAVQTRVMDFDLPENWFNQPEVFFHQDYQVKVEMLKDLMRGNMKGLSFADIRLRETVRYLNAMAEIANVGRERTIDAQIEAFGVQEEVRRRLTAKGEA